MLDIIKEVDKLIDNFPLNRKIQEAMGLIGQNDQPYRSFGECPLHTSDPEDVRVAISQSLLELLRDMHEPEPESHLKDELSATLQEMNRIKMLLILSASPGEVIEGVDPRTLRVFLETDRSGQISRMIERLQKLLELSEQNQKVNETLRKLLD